MKLLVKGWSFHSEFGGEFDAPVYVIKQTKGISDGAPLST